MKLVRTSRFATTHGLSFGARLLGLLTLLALAGCSSPSDYRIAMGPRASDGDLRSLSWPLAFARGADAQLYTADGWSVRGVAFRGELSSAPVHVGTSATLSFMPFAVSPWEGPVELRLEAVTQRGNRVLYQSRFGKGRKGPLDEEGIVNIDLSSMAGETFTLRWLLDTGRPGASGAEIVIGFARISQTGPGRALPNIIVICSDTHRADYGVGEHMPHLTQFAGDSVVFDQAIANASWTIPSVVSFLTGLEPYRHGTGWRVEYNLELMKQPENQTKARKSANISNKENYNVVLFNDELTTLQEVLERRGYLASAWTENGWVEICGVLADGFSQFVTQGALKTLADRDVADQGGRMLEEHAQAFLRTRPPGVPFFLYLHSKHVHDYVREPENIEANGGDLSRAIGDPAERAKTLKPEAYAALYAKRVREFDEQLGALFEVLREEGVYEESMIVFYSDHGEQLMDCDINAGDNNVGDNNVGADDIGHGNALTETLLQVPLIIKMPASSGVAHARIADTVQLIDVFPTVLDLLERYGVAPAADRGNGRTLLPRMLKEAPLEPALIQSGIQYYGDEMAALRDSTVKLITNLTTGQAHTVEWTVTKGCETLEETPKDPAASEALTQRLDAAAVYLLNVALSGELNSLEQLTEEQMEELRVLGYLQ